jgi:hypothetical protein
MTLTPEKVAFIRGSTAKAEKTPSRTATTEDAEKTVEFEGPVADAATENAKPQRRRSRARASTPEQPQANEILDQILVPVTFRLQHRTAQALKRAALEQKLKHLRPDKLQEIGEEAITEWLEKSGYLE